MSDTSANNKRIAKNTIYMGIRMMVVLLLQLYTTRVILEALGVIDYGIYNVVCGFVSMFTFLSASMTNAIQRFYNFEFGKHGNEGLNRVYNTAIRVQVVLAIMLFVVIETIGLWYINYKMVLPPERYAAAFWVFQSSVLSLMFVVLQIPYSAIIIAVERMNIYALVSILNSILSLLIAIMIQFSDYDRLIVYGTLLAILQLSLLIIYNISIKRIAPNIKLEKELDRTLLYLMLGFSGWNIFGALGGILKDQGANMLLNLFFGPVVNAARAVAVQVNGGFQGLISNLSIAVRPQVVKSYAQGNIGRTMNLTYSMSKLTCLLLYMFSYPLLLEVDYVLEVWLGDNVPEHTKEFVIIIVITSFWGNMNSAVSAVVHSTGKMKVYQISGCCMNLLALPVVYICLNKGCSPESALWVLCGSMVFVQTSALLVLKTIIEYKVTEYIKYAVFPFIYVLALSLLPPYLLHESLPYGISRFLVVCSFTVVEIAGISYLVGLSKNEKQIILNILYGIYSKLPIR